MRFLASFLISFFMQSYFSASSIKPIYIGDVVAKIAGKEVSKEVFPADVFNKSAITDSIIKSRRYLDAVAKTTPTSDKNFSTKQSEGVSTNIESDPVTIFITPGTTVVGLEDVRNIKLVPVQTSSKAKKVSNNSLSEQISIALSEKKIRVKEEQKAKFKKLDVKIVYKFYNTPVSDSGIKKQSKSFFAAIISPFNLIQKSAIHASESKYAMAITMEVRKQKFATSLSYLQFGILRNSFLRGPPKFS